MSKVELIMPKMGESVAEATIISWQKEVGETIEIDEPIVEELFGIVAIYHTPL